MSSLVRRLQIRGLKARGYRRTNFVLAMRDGGIHRVPVRRGGLIANSNNQIISAQWPQGRSEMARLRRIEQAPPIEGSAQAIG